MNYLAIDPGNCSGIAALDAAGRLTRVEVTDVESFTIRPGYDCVVIEKPRVYPARASKGDPNDLITLAIGVGQYKEKALAAGARVKLVEPHTWKGTIKKELHHPRIWAALSPLEQHFVAERMKGVTVSKRHNAMDAIGLAKWAFSNGLFVTRSNYA